MEIIVMDFTVMVLILKSWMYCPNMSEALPLRWNADCQDFYDKL
jgi:hypothetical protein